MLHLKVQTALDGGGFHARVSGMHAQGPGGHHGPASPEVDVEEFLHGDEGSALARTMTIRTRRRGLVEKRRQLADLLARRHLREAVAPRRASSFRQLRRAFTKLPLEVDRSAVFDSSAEQLLAATGEQMYAGLNIIYRDADGRAEAGVDSGGLTAEWFHLISTELTRANADVRPMFRLLQDNSLFLAPSSRHLMFYMALGRAVGVCVLYNCRGDNTVLSASLSSALLKFMVDEPITADDVRAIDPLYFKNRMLTLLEPGGVELMAMVLGLDELFFVDLDDELETRGELKPGGAGLRVTEHNKAECAQPNRRMRIRI
jgi:hypothetical protein